MIKSYAKNKDLKLIDSLTTELTLEYMEEVVKNGTAKSMELEGLGGAGGKTGTAEAMYMQKPTVHGWFAGYYPAKKPKYSVVILIENTQLGSRETLPIFKKKF